MITISVIAAFVSAGILLLALPLQAMAQIFPAPNLPSANSTVSRILTILLTSHRPITYNVNVLCLNGQAMHKTQTVQSGQPQTTIKVNCGTTSAGGGTSGTPVPGPAGPPGPPATICIVTPTNQCTTTTTNSTTVTAHRAG